MYDPLNPLDISYDTLLIDVSKIVDISYDSFFPKERTGVLGACEDLSVKDMCAYLERRIRNDISYGAYL